MAKDKKNTNLINVGALKDDSTYEGIYFSDDLFSGIPTKLRIKVTDWEPRAQYDNKEGKWIEGTLSSITFKAYNESLLQGVAALNNQELLDQVLSNTQLLTITVSVPDEKTLEYKDLLRWTSNLAAQIENPDNEGKDMIFDNCACHVVPISLHGKGNYGKYKGLGVSLFNLLKVKVSFVEPLQ